MNHSTSAVLSLVLLTTLAGCTKESAASGTGGTRLALSKPSNQTLTQGESNKVAVSVDRTGFAEQVRVSFSNLPSGVSVADTTIPPGDSSKDFVLVAAADAEVVDKRIVTVRAEGAGIDASQTFELTVKSKR